VGLAVNPLDVCQFDGLAALDLQQHGFVSQGKTTTPPVSTSATVVGISQQPDKSMLLQIQGGKTIKLTDVKRIDG